MLFRTLRRAITASSLAFIGACTTMVPPAHAQMGNEGTDIPVLVLADDASDTLLLSGGSSVSTMALSFIEEQFNRYQYHMVSKSAVDLAVGPLNQPVDEVGALEIAQLARGTKRPELYVRAAVIYKVYARAEPTRNGNGAKRAFLDVTGKVIDVESSRVLGNFNWTDKDPVTIRPGCDEACASAAMRPHAKNIGTFVAGEARDKVALLTKGPAATRRTAPPPPVQVQQTAAPQAPAPVANSCPRPPWQGLVNTYGVTFENLRMDEVLNIKRQMECEVPGFVRSNGMNGVAPLIEYSYVTKAPQDKMHEWLTILVSDMGVADTRIEVQGNSIMIRRFGSDLPPPPPAGAGGRFH